MQAEYFAGYYKSIMLLGLLMSPARRIPRVGGRVFQQKKTFAITTFVKEEVHKMAQKITGYIKLQIPAGKATPAPPVGPALGQHGVNIVQFTKEFNEKTAKDAGLIIPVVITVYADRSFTFITKTPPAAVLLKKAAKIDKASGTPNKTKVATISKDAVKQIAEQKMPDLNAATIEAAMSMIAGTARSMGIVVED